MQFLNFENSNVELSLKSSVLHNSLLWYLFAEPGVFPLTQALEVTNKYAIKSILISFIQNGAELQIRYSDIIHVIGALAIIKNLINKYDD